MYVTLVELLQKRNVYQRGRIIVCIKTIHLLKILKRIPAIKLHDNLSTNANNPYEKYTFLMLDQLV